MLFVCEQSGEQLTKEWIVCTFLSQNAEPSIIRAPELHDDDDDEDDDDDDDDDGGISYLSAFKMLWWTYQIIFVRFMSPIYYMEVKISGDLHVYQSLALLLPLARPCRWPWQYNQKEQWS